jgi:hypothetical protein
MFSRPVLERITIRTLARTVKWARRIGEEKRVVLHLRAVVFWKAGLQPPVKNECERLT